MAWTTPVDQVTGFLVTASVYNSQIIDNLTFLHGDAGVITLNNAISLTGNSFQAGAGSTAIGGNAGVNVDPGGRVWIARAANAAILTGTVTGDTGDFRVSIDADGTYHIGPNGGVRDTALSRSNAGAFKAANVVRQTRATITYSASMTPDPGAAEWQTISVTNATAFTINAPSPAPSSAETQWLTLEIFNNTAGAIGAATFNAAFIMTTAAGTAYAAPAAGKRRALTFKWSGNSWIGHLFTPDF